jgi:hypothetical protein
MVSLFILLGFLAAKELRIILIIPNFFGMRGWGGAYLQEVIIETRRMYYCLWLDV